MSKTIQVVIDDQLYRQLLDKQVEEDSDSLSFICRRILREHCNQPDRKPSPVVQPVRSSTIHQPTEPEHVEEIKELTYDLST